MSKKDTHFIHEGIQAVRQRGSRVVGEGVTMIMDSSHLKRQSQEPERDVVV